MGSYSNNNEKYHSLFDAYTYFGAVPSVEGEFKQLL